MLVKKGPKNQLKGPAPRVVQIVVQGTRLIALIFLILLFSLASVNVLIA